MMTRVLLIAALLLGFSGTSFAADVAERYGKTCAVCHAAGAAGAPKTGDAAAWKPRMDKGMDVLVDSVENGLNAMPPKGMCFDCSADDYKALIIFMAEGK